VGRGHFRHYTERVPFLIRKFSALIQNHHAFSLRSGDKEKLLILIGSEFFKALMQKQRADDIAAALRLVAF
jgi:hypothetical protein